MVGYGGDIGPPIYLHTHTGATLNRETLVLWGGRVLEKFERKSHTTRRERRTILKPKERSRSLVR